jgi:hypothetical protein
MSEWLDWGVVNKLSISMDGKGLRQKRNFQHSWKDVWSKNVSFSMVRQGGDKKVNFSMPVKSWTDWN